MSTPSDNPRPRKALRPPTAVPPNPAKGVVEALTLAALPADERPDDGCHDTDAARRLAKALIDKARYVPGLGWVWWDGCRWAAVDQAATANPGEIHQIAAEVAAEFTLQVRREPFVPRKGVTTNPRISKAEGLQSANHIAAAVKMAQHHRSMPLQPARLNCDDWVLNVKNGTLDLRTGVLRPHNKEDYLTRMANVEYVPEARHQALDRLLATLESRSPGMADYLARCFGCALTGDASIESLFMILGEGGSGKTTIADSFGEMLGDYAVKTDFTTFTDSKFGKASGQAAPELLGFLGARYVLASEGSRRAALDAGKVKQLTGNETVTARTLYAAQYLTIRPTWKIFLVSNFDPRSDSDDTGLHRRIVAMTFLAVPQDQIDPGIKHALLNDPAAKSALLAWAVRGCLDWQGRGRGRPGLAIPESVNASTRQYWEAQDTMAPWWDELFERAAVADTQALENKTVSQSEYAVSTTELFGNYMNWCRRNSVPHKSVQKFAEAVRARGFFYVQARYGPEGRPTRIFKGIKRATVDVDLRMVDSSMS